MKVDCSVWYPSFATSTWRPFINTVFPEYSLSSLCMENSSSSMRTWFQYLLFWKTNCSPEHSPDGFNFPLIWSCFLLEQQTLTTWPRYPKLLVCNNSLQVAGERMMGTSNSNVVIPPWRRSTICAQETAVLVLFTLHSKVRIFWMASLKKMFHWFFFSKNIFWMSRSWYRQLNTFPSFCDLPAQKKH